MMMQVPYNVEFHISS